MNFPEIGLANAPEIEILKKYWMSFPEIRLSLPGKLKFRKIFWMSFPEFANKGFKDHFERKTDWIPSCSVCQPGRPDHHNLWSIRNPFGRPGGPENKILSKLLKVFTLYPLVECHFKYDLIRSGIDFCINSDQYSMGTFPLAGFSRRKMYGPSGETWMKRKKVYGTMKSSYLI